MPEARQTILVVDDDEDVLSVARGYLEYQGYQVLQATSGDEGLRVLKSGAKVDLLFTDIVMPGGMDGFDLAHQAKQLRPELRILYTSGFLKDTPWRDRAGPDSALLPKPWRLAHLDEAVRRALD